MTKKLLLMLFLCYARAAYCQDKAFEDSLVRDLGVQVTDTGKIKTLSELTFLYATNNTPLALQYAQQQKTLADKVNIPKFSANALNDLAIVQYYTGQYSDALKNNKAALAIREGLGDKALVISSLNKLALICQDLGNYEDAAKYQFRILKLADELKQETFTGITYNNLAFLYDKLKSYAKSKEFSAMALSIALKNDDKQQMARSYGNMALSYEHTQQFDSAIIAYQTSIKWLKEANDLNGLATAYHDLGITYRSVNDDAAGLASYQKAYKIAGEIGNVSDHAFYASSIGSVLVNMRRPAEAFPYLQTALATAVPDTNLEILKTAYNALSNYYFLQSKPDSAFHYQQLYKDVIDSLYSATSSRQILDLQTSYETEKKEQQISLLNKENTIQKLSLSRNRTLLGIAIGIILAGFGFGFLIYNRNKLKQNARLQEEVMRQQEIATEAVIEAEENERKRIARDLHDGVGQMMSAAKMNLSLLEENIRMSDEEKTAFDKAVLLVDESCREVRSVSHNMMPNALIKSGLASAVRTFIDQIESPALKVQLYTEGLNESLNKNTETVLYRVLQECVNNVIKHAKASNLDIALIKDESGINATIEDNGRGFDTSDKSKFSGIGLDNMQKRISFLKGTIEWQSSSGAGTLVAIHVPS
jgi:two-component system NarL family sensor kinase